MKLWFPKDDFRGKKVLLVAQLCGLEIEAQEFNWEYTNSKEFLSISPLKNVPVLEINSETYLSDSISIMIYICQISHSELYSGPLEKIAKIDLWLEIIQNQIEPAMCNWISPYFGLSPSSNLLQDKSSSDVMKHLTAIDILLKQHTYLCGDELTLADISLVSALVYPFRMLIDENQRKIITSVVELFINVEELPQFKEIWGNVKFYTTPIDITEIKQSVIQERQKLKMHIIENKVTEYTYIPKINPLDELPISSFNLDDWKRYYSNEKDKRSAMKLFWREFDEEVYSLWWFKYQKIEGECEKVYITCNAVEGFLQRIDNFRKYCFGVLGVYGDEPNLEIIGLFMWRGKGIPREMADDPSFEYYDKLELSSDNPEHRQRVEDYWCNLTEDWAVDGLIPREVFQFK